jgi:hypothetical protein
MCSPTQITIRFTVNMTVGLNDYIIVHLPGVTSSACNGQRVPPCHEPVIIIATAIINVVSRASIPG